MPTRYNTSDEYGDRITYWYQSRNSYTRSGRMLNWRSEMRRRAHQLISIPHLFDRGKLCGPQMYMLSRLNVEAHDLLIHGDRDEY